MTYEEQLKQYRDDGKSVKEMCELLGKSERTLSRHLKKYGLTNSGGRSDINDDDVFRLWNDGYTIVEIANKYNASHETISKRLGKYGISCSRRDGIRRHFDRVNDDKWNDIKRDLDLNLGLDRIARKFHIRYQALIRLMLQHDYPYDYDSLKDSAFDEGVSDPDENNKSADRSRSMGIAKFVQRSRDVHGDCYDYSKVEYKNTKTKVCIICRQHGEFWQTPEKHLSGHGCPACAVRKTEQTNLKKYGVRRPLQSQVIRDKMKSGVN